MYISRAECAQLRTSINSYSNICSPNKDVKEALEETEQFYKELTIVNQFSGQPFVMPPPHKCVSNLTYRLAITFATWTNPSKVIPRLFNNNKLLIKLTEEIQTFVT
jgi:hypothetical protein